MIEMAKKRMDEREINSKKTWKGVIIIQLRDGINGHIQK
jgi:hypothetical protein